MRCLLFTTVYCLLRLKNEDIIGYLHGTIQFFVSYVCSCYAAFSMPRICVSRLVDPPFKTGVSQWKQKSDNCREDKITQ